MVLQPARSPRNRVEPAQGLAGAGRQRLLLAALLYLLFALLTVLLAGLPTLREAFGQVPRDDRGAGLYFRATGADGPVLAAPLVHSEVEIAIRGPVARTTLRQYFLNVSDEWMEGVYVFPLPEDSAVDRLTLIVGERRIEGEIHERQEARRIYEQAKAEGRRAGLLTGERANVFTTAVANIGPRQAVSVEIAFQERVGYDDGWYELRFPLVVAPRYSPDGPHLVVVPMPPAAGTGPIPTAGPTAAPPAGEQADPFGPVIDPASGRLVPTAAITVALDAGLPLQDIESPTHTLLIESLADGSQRIALAAGAVESDRDFVLRWQPQVAEEPRTALFAEQVGQDSFLLATLLPAPASRPTEEDRQPRDLILVVDNSGSMFGPSIEQAKTAVLLALDRLTADDRVNVIRFDDETERLFERARPATPDTLNRARRFVASLQAEGGTEMLPALQTALGEPADPERLLQIVFVTDGAVTNEEELFRALDAKLGERRLFTVGIGSAPNSWFMTKAAELGRGGFTFVDSASQLADRMGTLFRKLEEPVVTDLTATWRGIEAVEMAPMRLPDLYAGEPVELSARVRGVPLDGLGGTLVLEGRRAGDPWRTAVSLDELEDAEGVSAIWARGKLVELENALSRGQSEGDVRAEAIPLALAHRLVTRWTSLVAVEQEGIARPTGESVVSRQVPRALPYGWSYEKVFGQTPHPTGGVAPGTPLQRALEPRPATAEELAQTAAFTGGSRLALPQTATNAPWRTLVGGLAVLLALVLLGLARRSRACG